MKKTSFLLGTLFCSVALITLSECSTDDKSEKHNEKDSDTTSDPFLNHRDSIPSKQQYSTPLFELSHDYPTTFTPVVDPSWQMALNGSAISAANALAYMDSLKSYIEPNIVPFFQDNETWTAAAYGWFNEPWTGANREAILGASLGNGNPANMFKSLKEDEAGYALVLYDSTAAYTLGQVWGATGEKANLVNDAAQFEEGSVIIKFAFSNVNYPQWPVMKDAQVLSIYDTIPTSANSTPGYQMRKVSFFQMDVIVKDSQTAPKTGWVFSTFVYDSSIVGNFWDKMVPLGAMWGNDPEVMSSEKPPYLPLYETVINPDAPAYSVETLGWGGRLSGPNDGAVAMNVYDSSGTHYERLAMSSCMSCHSVAQHPITINIVPGINDSTYYTPGSYGWNRYFRDNYGNVPFTVGDTATDYDLVMALQALPAFDAAQASGGNQSLKDNVEKIRQTRQNKVKVISGH